MSDKQMNFFHLGPFQHEVDVLTYPTSNERVSNQITVL